MPELAVSNLHKSFGAVHAVDGIDFTLDKGEILALLGPSGCGKTTTLRLIAGFEHPDAGTVTLQGDDLLAVAPERRKIGFVFQNYALFPHMNVAQNIAYGIRFAPHHRERVQKLLALVDLSGLEKRYPRELSSGQCQRVALARALAPQPRLLLLDEPLSALDAKLRESLRQEIRRIQREVNLSTIHVTHDQDEAMAISDHIAVMNAGRIEQIGTPSEVYSRPRSAFVASFIGHANVVEGTVISANEGALEIDAGGLRLRTVRSSGDFHLGDDALLFCKEEDARLGGEGENCVPAARIIITEYHGEMISAHLESQIGPLRVRLPASMASNVQVGREVSVFFPPEACQVFLRKES